MQANYSTNLIVPSYQQLASESATLEQAVNTFSQSPTEASLQAAQAATLSAWSAFQRTIAYNAMGPAFDVNLTTQLGYFPTRSSAIEARIAEGSWDFSRLYAEEYKGFAALDYLLFGYDADGNGNSESNQAARPGTAAEVLTWYTTHSQAATRKQYVQQVAADIADLSQEVYNEWQAEDGNFAATFAENTSTGAGSSVSLLVNSYIVGYEWVKRHKLFFPLGGRSGQVAPGSVEALYSRQSLTLLEEVTDHLEEAFTGADGLGLDDYLKAHFDAGNTQVNYAQEMNTVFDTNQAEVAKISVPLQEALETNKAAVQSAYDQYQSAVATLKVDITSVLGVGLTFTDNDGD